MSAKNSEEQASLALCNLIGQGYSMKDARAKLGLDKPAPKPAEKTPETPAEGNEGGDGEGSDAELLGGEGEGEAAKDGGELTVAQLTEALNDAGIEIPKGSRKGDLVKLYRTIGK